jgi:hypothetical protein
VILRREHRALALALMLVAAAPHAAFAYLKLSVRTVAGDVVSVRWSRTPVRWFASDRTASGVTASEFQGALTRAFTTWQAVPTATIDFQFVGVTGARPSDDDGMNVLGFQDRPELERVLGQTEFTVDRLTGDLVEADIFFNASFNWSVATPGVTGRFDIESVALHEVGHLLGLGHSALGETELMPNGRRRVTASGAVMFPIAFGPGNTLDRELQPDDVAGVSDIYPSGTHRSNSGAARGRVMKNGQPVFGAHVIAFNPETDDVIAGFTVNEQGEFEITGLAPGPQVIRVEPLDDADTESFFGRSERIDVDFQVTYLDRLFVAPRGGVGARFDVAVKPK